MPKTKYQKQQEAIARKRAFLHEYRELLSKAVAGRKDITTQFGEAEAQHRIDAAQASLKEAARQAHCDVHGNPLEG